MFRPWLVLVLVTDAALVDAQTRDQQAATDMLRASREVIRTAADADRIDTEHLVLYIDRGLLSADEERQFSVAVERGFVAASEYLHRLYDVAKGTPKPAYYLTNRAGISHAGATTVFLFAQRVVASPAIAIHESVHLLLIQDPLAPRNREDLPPEEDARLTAASGVWLAEGLASFVADELAARVNLAPTRLFFSGDNATVDEEARRWLGDPRGAKVAPFVGSRGVPDDFLADRAHVAAPFYVLGQSLVKHMVQRTGIAVLVQLYEEHFNGTRPIEDDVKRVTGFDLQEWRQNWLRAISAPVK
jgi:hypothetical protein